MTSAHHTSKELRWSHLYETAAPQAGYFTVADAEAAGYSSPLLEYYVQHGYVERIQRGIFRLVHFPPGDNEDLVVAWLWSDRTGVFSHETALQLHQLSDALPAKHHVTVPKTWEKRRLRVPAILILHYDDVPESDQEWMGPVPVTTPIRTIQDCIRDHVPREFIEQAVEQMKRRGLCRASVAKQLLRRERGLTVQVRRR